MVAARSGLTVDRSSGRPHRSDQAKTRDGTMGNAYCVVPPVLAGDPHAGLRCGIGSRLQTPTLATGLKGEHT